jgi:plastocyanin
MRPLLNSVLASSVTLLMACSGAASTSAPNTNTNTPAPPAPGTPNSIVITNNSFTPSVLTTSVGAQVTWTWDTCRGGDGYGSSQTCTGHDVLFDESTSSGTQSRGTYTRSFTTAGTYPYHCRIHGRDERQCGREVNAHRQAAFSVPREDRSIGIVTADLRERRPRTLWDGAGMRTNRSRVDDGVDDPSTRAEVLRRPHAPSGA